MMSKFRILHELAGNSELQKRFIAAAFVLGVEDPEAWVYTNRWRLVATPGWVEAYLAQLPKVVVPDEDAAPDFDQPELYDPTYIITDEQITAAITALRQAAAEAPAPDPEEGSES